MEKEKIEKIALIEKEEIGNYKVIKAKEDHTEMLTLKLKNALRLGNEFKTKSTIIFQTDDGLKRIETTIWTLTDGYLQIKSGVVIPLNSLVDIYY